jgi:hypothetical protein
MTPSEITSGSLFLSRGDGMKSFFREIDNTFTIIAKWETLYERRAGSQYIWLGYQFMRHFNPYDVVKISKKDTVVYLEKYVKH